MTAGIGKTTIVAGKTMTVTAGKTMTRKMMTTTMGREDNDDGRRGRRRRQQSIGFRPLFFFFSLFTLPLWASIFIDSGLQSSQPEYRDSAE